MVDGPLDVSEADAVSSNETTSVRRSPALSVTQFVVSLQVWPPAATVHAGRVPKQLGDVPELLQPALHLPHKLSVVVHRGDERERVNLIAPNSRRVSSADGMTHERNQYGVRNQAKNSRGLGPLQGSHERGTQISSCYRRIESVNPARRR